MAAVKISRGVDATDRADAVPREQWPELVEARRDYCRSAIIGDCRLIVQFAADAEAADWLGFDSKDSYLQDGLGLDPQMVEWAIEGLKSLGVDSPVSLEEAKTIGRHGGDRRSAKAREAIQGNSDNLDARGTSRDYTIARLDRDAPRLAERVRAGELSANAAAIEAGFRKRPTALSLLRAAWRKATKSERETFLEEVA